MKLYFIFFLLVLGTSSFKPEEEVTKWQYGFSSPTLKKGDQVELLFTSKVEKGWYLYSSDFDPDLGPGVTEFEFKKNESFELIGSVVPVNAETKYDKTYEGEVRFFKNKAIFKQKILLKSDHPEITGTIRGQVCNDKKGLCLPFVENFSFSNL